MIFVNFRFNKRKQITAFKIIGHATNNDKLVCNSVSTAVQITLIQLFEILNIEGEYINDTGYCEVLTRKFSEYSNNAMLALLNYLEKLEKLKPKSIKIERTL